MINWQPFEERQVFYTMLGEAEQLTDIRVGQVIIRAGKMTGPE